MRCMATRAASQVGCKGRREGELRGAAGGAGWPIMYCQHNMQECYGMHGYACVGHVDRRSSAAHIACRVGPPSPPQLHLPFHQHMLCLRPLPNLTPICCHPPPPPTACLPPHSHPHGAGGADGSQPGGCGQVQLHLHLVCRSVRGAPGTGQRQCQRSTADRPRAHQPLCCPGQPAAHAVQQPQRPGQSM